MLEAPVHEAAEDDALLWAVHALQGRRVAVLTGAGMSTASGIPDYRGPASQGRPRHPMRHETFVTDENARQRYWCRATLGWPTILGAVPNDAHRALADLSVPIVTQNVDRLHHRAGSVDVVELHGSLHLVRCLGCGALHPRGEVHADATAANPTLRARVSVAPDGDVDVDDAVVQGFVVPRCRRCGADLMPDVVFFGGVVPPSVKAAATAVVDDAQALLVCGTSLEVWSGRRLVEVARRRRIPIILCNDGPTRVDGAETVRVPGRLEQTLPALVAALRA